MAALVCLLPGCSAQVRYEVRRVLMLLRSGKACGHCWQFCWHAHEKSPTCACTCRSPTMAGGRCLPPRMQQSRRQARHKQGGFFTSPPLGDDSALACLFVTCCPQNPCAPVAAAGLSLSDLGSGNEVSVHPVLWPGGNVTNRVGCAVRAAWWVRAHVCCWARIPCTWPLPCILGSFDKQRSHLAGAGEHQEAHRA